jgi:hypothetical protein
MFPQDALNQAPIANGMPAPLRFMLAHPQLLFGGFLVASATALVSSIGLLKRRNWGRLMFIGILILAIAWNLVGLVLTLWSFPLVPPMPEHAPSDLRDGFRTMWIAMIVISVAIAIAVSALLGWLAKRLTSPEIKREFVSG